jgi:L-rhamnono-1,4-lactonase
MAPSRILDAHIHLWPATALQPTNHGWMASGHQLAKQHGISEYKAVTESVPVGFVYVETDRYLPSAHPDLTGEESDDQKRRELQEWAKEPLEELKFLRRIVEDEQHEGDSFEKGDGALMKGCVVWAPFHVSTSLFQAYMSLAEDTAGPRLWSRVVGFRYLLQGKTGEEVRDLTGNVDWLENIMSLGRGRDGKGWAFDVGVDTHRDGDEPLERVADMIEAVRLKETRNGEKGKGVRFVLSKCLEAIRRSWLNLSRPSLQTQPLGLATILALEPWARALQIR